MEVRAEFVPTAEAALEARLLLEELKDLVRAEVLEDARILVAELVTNSVRHAGLSPQDRITVRIVLSSEILRAEVCDPGPGFEAPPKRPGFRQTRGWGLYIVEQIAERWGIERDERQKCVWFELGPVRKVVIEKHAAGGRRRGKRTSSFSAQIREVRGVPVVAASGEVDLATFAELQATIEEAVERAGNSPGAMILDLHGVDFFDSMGIGVLVGSTRKLRERGGEVYLVAREGPCLRVLTVTGLDKVFKIHADLDPALKEATSRSDYSREP